MALVALPEGVDTKVFIEGPGSLAAFPELLSRINCGAAGVLLIQDRNTKKAAGDELAAILGARGLSCSEMVLDESLGGPMLHGVVGADYEWVKLIREKLKNQKVFPVAVGGGTINDLVKRAAGELEIPYACVGTAASVDGYCSFGASLVCDGFKTTIPCPAPAGVIADTNVLASAPCEMTASGYGDLYAKLPAGVDWFLADHLGIEKIHKEAWDLVQKDLPFWLAEPGKLKSGDTEALSGIFRGLTMSGCAMQVYRDSRPASGAEHFLSHVWEMEHLSRDGVPLSHGFKVAMGTVIAVSLMEAFYSLSPAEISVDACRPFRQSWEERLVSIEKRFPDPHIREMIVKGCAEKWIDDDEWAVRVRRIAQLLPELKEFAAQRFGSREKVIRDLRAAGCPVSPGEFDVPPERIKDTVIKAQMMRKRYTVLDALYETGQLEKMLNRLY